MTRKAGVDCFRDAESFWGAVAARRSDVVCALYARYPCVPRAYIARYFLSFLQQNLGNPRALLYLDAELAAPDRGAALLRALESVGVTTRGARCLDIGCSNGALLLAAAAQGASRSVGAEISPDRLRSARRLTNGSGIELLELDIARDRLPDGYGPFDLIFCIDTLEHVSSAAAMLAAVKRHLDAGTRSCAFVSVFNPRHPSNIFAEPHYGVPAMVLLPPDEARSLWGEVRSAYGSGVEYEVSEWVPYGEIVEILRHVGLTAGPFVDSRPILDKERPFWAGFRERIEEVKTRVSTGIHRLPARPALRELLQTNLRRYCDQYLQDHVQLSSTTGVSDEALIAFFMDYYAQPIQLVLRHA
jgi:SAM-dependent methyltransferase